MSASSAGTVPPCVVPGLAFSQSTSNKSSFDRRTNTLFGSRTDPTKLTMRTLLAISPFVVKSPKPKVLHWLRDGQAMMDLLRSPLNPAFSGIVDIWPPIGAVDSRPKSLNARHRHLFLHALVG